MRFAIILAAAWACLVANAAPPRDEGRLDGAALYERVRASSVEILVAGRQDGSGWFASDDGLVVTAAHVVWGHVGRTGEGHRVEEMSGKVGRIDAEIIAVDRGHDIALLRGQVEESKQTYLENVDKKPTTAETGFVIGAA